MVNHKVNQQYKSADTKQISLTMNAVLLFASSLLLLGTSCYAGPCGCSSQKKLPARLEHECDTTYYKRIFPIDISCGCKDTLKTFYENVFCQFEGETAEEYVTRIDIIFEQIYQKFDCRTDSIYADYLEQYYTCKYGKKTIENDEVFFKRVLEKSSECASEYRNKIKLMKRFIKSVDWSKVKIEENKSTGYSLIKKGTEKKREHEKNVEIIESKKQEHVKNVKNIEAKEREHEENVEKWIKANYKRKSGESIESYFSRICSKDSISDEEYVNRLTMARSLYPDLELWYNVKYLDIIKSYYEFVFARKAAETEEEYFARLFRKEHYESEELFLNRINLIKQIFSSLPCWYDERFYETYTYKLYQHCYKKGENEQDEHYLKRVFTKLSGESEQHFWMRIKLIKKAFPDYPCWYVKENIKHLNVCKSLHAAKSIQDLKKRIVSENISEECRETKIECLKTFFTQHVQVERALL